MEPRKVAIFGSTGSIGLNTLRVIDRYPDRFKIVALTANNNVRVLERQIKKYEPTHAAVGAKGMDYLRRHVSSTKTKILDADEDLESIASLTSVDIVVLAMPGSKALRPFLAAVQAGKRIAPANKEALVIAGHLIMAEVQKHKAEIIPVDSEQSAIFQCLAGRGIIDLKRVLLTASGGALLDVPQRQFDKLSVRHILDHPRWKMGRKITVDSATLMNKGFEVIEAKWLFNLDIDQIDVIVHPEAIIHSMVEFKDGSVIAQLGVTDMRLPIQFALSYPERVGTGLKTLDLCALQRLTFQKPDFKKFPSLSLAFDAARKGGTMPCVLNAADEEAVEAFLNKRMPFTHIFTVVEKVVLKHKIIKKPNLNDIFDTDRWAREEARKVISN